MKMAAKWWLEEMPMMVKRAAKQFLRGEREGLGKLGRERTLAARRSG
jgi:hypothetical protein